MITDLLLFSWGAGKRTKIPYAGQYYYEAADTALVAEHVTLHSKDFQAPCLPLTNGSQQRAGA